MKKINTLDQLKQDIQTIVDYNWGEESQNFNEYVRENGDDGAHIFTVLKRLQAWIE